MTKHTTDLECPKCTELFLDGNARLKDLFLKAKIKFPNLHTSCVFRGEIEQNKLFDEGKSRVRFPKSRHNLKPSEAFDAFFLVDGKASFAMTLYKQLSEFYKESGSPVEWGGDFLNFKDGPHFQLKR